MWKKLKTQYDYILIDCPAGIEQGFRNAIAAATTAVVVTTPEVSAIRDADRIIGLLEKDGMASIYLLVNKLRPDLVKKGDMMSRKMFQKYWVLKLSVVLMMMLMW